MLNIHLPSELASERLIIRPPSINDAEFLYEAIVDSFDELTRWLPWAKTMPSIDECTKTCVTAHQKFLANEDFMVLFFEKSSGLLVGASGLHKINWSLKQFEVGYWGRTQFTGKGLIYEGVKTLVDYAINHLAANRVSLTIDDKNLKSCKLAERLGFKLEGTLHSNKLDNAGELRNTKVYAIWK